jgi:signal transduction histidine kinase
MNRPRQTWILFGLSLIVVLIALSRVTHAALSLDNASRIAVQQSGVEERVRLALWRMDSALALLIAEEDARPESTYEAFYPSQNAFQQSPLGFRVEGVILPSPLLTYSSSNVWLHFQFGADGSIRSPQVPTGEFRFLAESNSVPLEFLDASALRLARLRTLLETASSPLSLKPLSTRDDSPARPSTATQVGPLTASWVSGELLLTRYIQRSTEWCVQGCWLNWNVIQRGLLKSIEDLLPEATLELTETLAATQPTRQLVALRGIPLELQPGSVSLPSLDSWSPTRITLAMAWLAFLCAASAVALLLNGAVSLSERRAAFVSAVTHELRTPLTTFQMYSEMLANDMVQDPAQRRRYLETLCAEAGRLGHLVENVLAYARIERGSARRRVELTTAQNLVERILPQLQRRTEQAGTNLICNLKPEIATVSIQVDVGAVEQILFNLVDNACKYGSGARVGAAPIELEIQIRGRKTMALRVRDHGPGIQPDVAAKLFEPFCKSADEAASTAPGIGLGLALCRRLARSMGGNLIWDATSPDGTCMELQLPLTSAGTEPTIA